MNQIFTKKAPAAIGPYSQAVRTGNLIFTSMQIPINPQNGNIPTGIDEQTDQVLKNLKAIAERAGSSLENAVKVTVYLREMKDFQDMNEVYGCFFGSIPPARAAVEVSRIPRDCLIAMDAVFEVLD